jgi:hypothetical protein
MNTTLIQLIKMAIALSALDFFITVVGNTRRLIPAIYVCTSPSQRGGGRRQIEGFVYSIGVGRLGIAELELCERTEED